MPMLSIRRRHFPKTRVAPESAGAPKGLLRRRNPGATESLAEDEESAPAYVRECVAGWHVCNGRDEVCFTFAKSYDGCRLHGRLLVLCKRLLFAIEVIEFRWDESAATFIEHRRYIDESPAWGDGG